MAPASNRVLGIHCPGRNVVALLIHSDYTDELRFRLKKFKVILKDDIDPCDVKPLRDPKYADATKKGESIYLSCTIVIA
ncbi:hypothetical protein CU097_011473 [Rhizopus azygosporus]|uniref:Uncharacterized protein n=1 Tax=Rhizopus azygosporus TaxID=86630 RepID=A0A367JJ23_RHIAZ|nr:hypothetical protein CU097_011473 [Rhizopus azygosporus]